MQVRVEAGAHGGRMGLTRLSRVGAMVTAIVGVAVLAGWRFDIGILKSLSPAFVAMKVNTACGFLAAGVALCMFSSPRPSTGRRRAGVVASTLVFGCGLLTIVEYVS